MSSELPGAWCGARATCSADLSRKGGFASIRLRVSGSERTHFPNRRSSSARSSQPEESHPAAAWQRHAKEERNEG